MKTESKKVMSETSGAMKSASNSMKGKIADEGKKATEKSNSETFAPSVHVNPMGIKQGGGRSRSRGRTRRSRRRRQIRRKNTRKHRRKQRR